MIPDRRSKKSEALNLEHGALKHEALNARARKIPLNCADGAKTAPTARAVLHARRQTGLSTPGLAEDVVLQRP